MWVRHRLAVLVLVRHLLTTVVVVHLRWVAHRVLVLVIALVGGRNTLRRGRVRGGHGSRDGRGGRGMLDEVDFIGTVGIPQVNGEHVE